MILYHIENHPLQSIGFMDLTGDVLAIISGMHCYKNRKYERKHSYYYCDHNRKWLKKTSLAEATCKAFVYGPRNWLNIPVIRVVWCAVWFLTATADGYQLWLLWMMFGQCMVQKSFLQLMMCDGCTIGHLDWEAGSVDLQGRPSSPTHTGMITRNSITSNELTRS